MQLARKILIATGSYARSINQMKCLTAPEEGPNAAKRIWRFANLRGAEGILIQAFVWPKEYHGEIGPLDRVACLAMISFSRRKNVQYIPSQLTTIYLGIIDEKEMTSHGQQWINSERFAENAFSWYGSPWGISIIAASSSNNSTKVNNVPCEKS